MGGVVQVAWEIRGSRRYYYRSVREGGRVRRVYVGNGPAAEAAARAAEVTRAIQRSARQRSNTAGHEEQDRLDAARTPLGRLDALADILATLALIDAGYHRPNRGIWRRRKSPC